MEWKHEVHTLWLHLKLLLTISKGEEPCKDVVSTAMTLEVMGWFMLRAALASQNWPKCPKSRFLTKNRDFLKMGGFSGKLPADIKNASWDAEYDGLVSFSSTPGGFQKIQDFQNF